MSKIALLRPGKAGDPGRTGSDNRLFVNGCPWVLRSGAHWRDLPERDGPLKRRTDNQDPQVGRRTRPAASVIITPGQAGDITQAPALLDGQTGAVVLAAKAYDSTALRQIIADMGAEAVIPSNRSRKIIIRHDRETYKHRNRIERCFNRLKHSRRFATCYERRTIHFLGFVQLVAATIRMT